MTPENFKAIALPLFQKKWTKSVHFVIQNECLGDFHSKSLWGFGGEAAEQLPLWTHDRLNIHDRIERELTRFTQCKRIDHRHDEYLAILPGA